MNEDSKDIGSEPQVIVHESTIYTQLQTAAQQSRQRWLDLENRIMSNMSHFVFDFREYCGAPVDAFQFSKWDGEQHADGKRLFKIEEGYTYTLPGAMTFDANDGYWRLGVRVNLTKNSYPTRYFFFVLALTERDGVLFAKMPDDSEGHLDMESVVQQRQVFDALVASIKESFDSLPNALLNASPSSLSIDLHAMVGTYLGLATPTKGQSEQELEREPL